MLSRNADGVLQLKSDGTSAAEFRVYGDGTATTTKYLALKHDGTNPIIDTDGSDLLIKDGGSTRLTIGTAVTFGGQASGGGQVLSNFVYVLRQLTDDTAEIPNIGRDPHTTNLFTAARTKALPAAGVGRHIQIIDDDAASRITITPASGDEIIWTDGTVVSAATGSIAFGARYQYVNLIAIDSTTWVVTNAIARGGAFTVTP